MNGEPRPLTPRICDAVNRHDLETVVACFSQSYRNETPVHPSRGFIGQAQVRQNWRSMFAAVPDLAAEVLRLAITNHDNGHTVEWSEWDMQGKRRDGAVHCMRGVIIFGVHGHQAQWARFYLEPVDTSGDSVNDAVGRLTGPTATPVAHP